MPLVLVCDIVRSFNFYKLSNRETILSKNILKPFGNGHESLYGYFYVGRDMDALNTFVLILLSYRISDWL